MGSDRFGLRSVELPIALARLHDIAGHADHAACASVRSAHHDAVLARPLPRAIAAAVEEFAIEAFNIATIECRDHARMMRAIIRVQPFGECADRTELGEPKNFHEGWSEV